MSKFEFIPELVVGRDYDPSPGQKFMDNFDAIFEAIQNSGDNSLNSSGKVKSENWNIYTNPSWYDSIIEGIRRPFAILSLGPFAIVKSIREIPTILLMNWAFRKGLMEFGVYKCRG